GEVPRVEQQAAEDRDLEVGQVLTVDDGGGECPQDVVDGRVGAAAGGLGDNKLGELLAGLREGGLQVLRGGALGGGPDAQEPVGAPAEEGPVGGGDAEHLGD